MGNLSKIEFKMTVFSCACC